MTPYAKNALTPDEAAHIAAREAELGVTVGALRSVRNREWCVSVSNGTRRVNLRGKGPLAAVIAGALDDYESQQAAA